jgi:hypothetical protein
MAVKRYPTLFDLPGWLEWITSKRNVAVQLTKVASFAQESEDANVSNGGVHSNLL